MGEQVNKKRVCSYHCKKESKLLIFFYIDQPVGNRQCDQKNESRQAKRNEPENDGKEEHSGTKQTAKELCPGNLHVEPPRGQRSAALDIKSFPVE